MFHHLDRPYAPVPGDAKAKKPERPFCVRSNFQHEPENMIGTMRSYLSIMFASVPYSPIFYSSPVKACLPPSHSPVGPFGTETIQTVDRKVLFANFTRVTVRRKTPSRGCVAMSVFLFRNSPIEDLEHRRADAHNSIPLHCIPFQHAVPWQHIADPFYVSYISFVSSLISFPAHVFPSPLCFDLPFQLRHRLLFSFLSS
jgi:hypothetical protein